MSNNCDSCGAGLSDGQEVCDLCGTSVGSPLEARLNEEVDPSQSESMEEGHSIDGVFCNSCGWENPTASNFCSKCGSALQHGAVGESRSTVARTAKVRPSVAASFSAPSPGASKAKSVKEAPADSQKAVGKQIGIIVASALLVVVALYFVTTMSKSGTSANSATVLPLDPGVEEPLASQFVPQQTDLREKMNGLEGEDLVSAKRELVDLYFAAGRFDLAGEETESIARLTNSENEWAIVGNLYYDWMERKDPAARTPWARKAIAAYQEVLKINPLNLDVRTDMAIAYMYDPQNSMMAIQETNAVLEQDSLHMQANFNRGIMLMQIDRTTQAAEQFEKVMILIGDSSDPVYQRAKDLADRLRSEIATANS